MITAVLVDDERPALRELDFLLSKFPDISIIEMYTNPLTAIDMISQLKPHVVFLDINMPQLRGIDAASMILAGSPDSDIVFVTAFDQYALEAFEVHALDYILKPINLNRLGKTIERLMKKKPMVQQSGDRKLKIKSLGQFKVAWDNQEPIKWRSEKTKELFAFLLQHKGRDIFKDELLDKLWMEDDPGKAIRHLYNGIYYIRKALNNYGIDKRFISIGSNYNLKLGLVDSDIESFDEFEKGNRAESIEELEKLKSLYTGEYLEGIYYPWANIERERLSKLYLQCMIKLSKKLIEAKQWDRAENNLLKSYHKNPYEEIITELLVKLYLETGNESKAVRHLHTYFNILKEELGIKPHERMRELYNSLNNVEK